MKLIRSYKLSQNITILKNKELNLIYNFACKKCKHEYEELCTRYDETGEYPDVSCPKCNSKKKNKLVSLVAEAVFAQPEGTSKWNRSHDLRYWKKMESVRAERELAEKVSHMGTGDEIYNNIDDITHGKSFGEVQ